MINQSLLRINDLSNFQKRMNMTCEPSMVEGKWYQMRFGWLRIIMQRNPLCQQFRDSLASTRADHRCSRSRSGIPSRNNAGEHSSSTLNTFCFRLRSGRCFDECRNEVSFHVDSARNYCALCFGALLVWCDYCVCSPSSKAETSGWAFDCFSCCVCSELWNNLWCLL